MQGSRRVRFPGSRVDVEDLFPSNILLDGVLRDALKFVQDLDHVVVRFFLDTSQSSGLPFSPKRVLITCLPFSPKRVLITQREKQGSWRAEVPVCGALGDQQAALVEQACFAPGVGKA